MKECLGKGRVKETLKQNGSNETKELFAFDPAHNLLNDENDQALKNNKIETYQDKRFKYDTYGNLTNKKISNHTNMDLSYDAQNQLSTAKVSKHKNTKKPITQTYHYTYDPFGRRVTKTDTFGTTYFTWDGNRLLTESRGDTQQSYIYEQFGFTPIASTNKKNELHYYHSDHLGTPQEVSNHQGETIWEAEYSTWGNTTKVTYKQKETTIQEEVAFQPLRFQGQYYDQETGLHYNRFRYYDPDIGRFISLDPIGLLGGTNLYQYVRNPMGWIDPLGLAAFSKATKDNVVKENTEFFGSPTCERCGVDLVKPQKSQKGVTPSPNEWQTDHIDPDSNGGGNTEDNAQLFCRKCNRDKSNNDDRNYKQENRDDDENDKKKQVGDNCVLN